MNFMYFMRQRLCTGWTIRRADTGSKYTILLSPRYILVYEDAATVQENCLGGGFMYFIRKPFKTLEIKE